MQKLQWDDLQEHRNVCLVLIQEFKHNTQACCNGRWSSHVPRNLIGVENWFSFGVTWWIIALMLKLWFHLTFPFNLRASQVCICKTVWVIIWAITYWLECRWLCACVCEAAFYKMGIRNMRIMRCLHTFIFCASCIMCLLPFVQYLDKRKTNTYTVYI